MKHFYNLNFSIKSFKIFKILILFFTTSLVYGQTTTFSGVGLWSDPINWDNGVPDAAIDVIIAEGATCSIDIDAECKSLTFAVNSIAESMVSILATNTLNVYEAITYSLPSANFRQTFEVNDGTLQCVSIYMPNVDNNNKRLALLINSGYVHVTGDFDMRANNNRNWIEFTDAGGLRVDGTLGFGNWGRIRAYNSTIVIGGDFNVATFEAGTSTVVFESAAPQRVDNVSYYNIELRAGGQKNLVANTTIIDDGSIFFDNGNLNLAGFMLTTQGNASFIGTPSATSMIDFTNNGILRIASTSQAHLERVFPIGSYGEYLPVEFSSVTSTNYSGNFDIVTVSQPHPLLSGIDNALERYLNFRTDNINIESFSGAFSYSDNDININTTETDLNTVGYFLSEWNDTLQGISVDCVNNEILFSNTPNLIGTWTLGKAAGCFEAVSPKFTIANGNWNAVATWNDGIVPVDGESVIIYHNIRNTTTIPVTVGNLLIDAGGSLDIERLEFTVLGKTNIYGNITDSKNEGFNSFLDSLIIHPTGSFSTGNSSPHVFGGGILNNGTFSKTGTGTVSFVKGNQILGGDNQITINGVVTINNLEVTNTGNVFLQNTGNSLTGSGSWIQAANSELYLWAGSLIDIAVFDAQAVNNTVYYNRLGAQAIREASTFYFNLELAGNNTKTFNGNINVLGNLDIYDVTVYIGNNADSRSHYIKGNIDINNGSLYTNNTNVIHALSIGGNLIVNGNFDIYNNINRYATLSFVEDNPRTISGTPLGFDVYNLDFSNNSNTTTLDFDIQASNNFLYKRKHYYW